ncbi:transposable element Tcb2 transposase [Trichonephila clavipes]|nr:transposable element Tcb2 transposase [Trichonephila clavipes]
MVLFACTSPSREKPGRSYHVAFGRFCLGLLSLDPMSLFLLSWLLNDFAQVFRLWIRCLSFHKLLDVMSTSLAICIYASINIAIEMVQHDYGNTTANMPAGRRAVFLVRWIVRSVPLEIVGSSEHEKVPTRVKPGLEQPGKPQEERIEGSCGKHLAETNLKCKRPFHALPLTPGHRKLRLQWCQARSIWNVRDWQKVVFSDESRLVLGTDDNRVRVWRRPGEGYNSPYTVLRHTARTAGVMVLGAIAYDSRSTLIVMRVTLTGQRYVDDILRPHVGPFLNGLPGAIFQQDNARPHTSRVAQDFLRHFQTLPWPARSPDLSPVEHVWDQLKRQMPSCHSVHDLELAVQDLWAHLPQDNIRCLINSMSDRVAACIADGGGPTRY